MIISLFLPFLINHDNKKLLSTREEELINDYPELISKTNLFINAGMSIHSSLARIYKDYTSLHEPAEYHYLYKELGLTLSLIESGTLEAYAYSDFGNRIGIPCYIKFGSLLEQNLKKGNQELSLMLTTEAITAMETKKRLLIEKGEKASTKLLLPMMMIFAVILIIIMIPAFLNITL